MQKNAKKTKINFFIKENNIIFELDNREKTIEIVY